MRVAAEIAGFAVFIKDSQSIVPPAFVGDQKQRGNIGNEAGTFDVGDVGEHFALPCNAVDFAEFSAAGQGQHTVDRIEIKIVSAESAFVVFIAAENVP